MRMCKFAARARAAATLFLLLASGPSQKALAHGFAGDRFFPATLTVDDPAVADELSAPTVSKINNGTAEETDVSVELSKRITENFGVSIGQDWIHMKPGPTGYDNLEVTFQYQIVTDAKHEVLISVGLGTEWETGASKIADPYNTYSPTIWFGKGFGDLPEAFNIIRPFAVTGEVQYAIPQKLQTFQTDTDSYQPNQQSVVWGVTVQYSLPYLNANIKEIGGPAADFLSRCIPLVEASLTTPASNFDGPGQGRTTGTINPGVIWVGNAIQVGFEALIPINRESGRGVGGLGQIHFYLDDAFPESIGKPLLELQQ